jgi:hypothetical protein
LVVNSDYIGSHLQERYLSGNVDVVVSGPRNRTMHEM